MSTIVNKKEIFGNTLGDTLTQLRAWTESGKITSQEERMVADNIGLIGWIRVHQFKNFPPDYIGEEDFISALTWGLLKAARTFKGEAPIKDAKGNLQYDEAGKVITQPTAFTTYAVCVMSNELRRVLRKHQTHFNYGGPDIMFSLDAEINAGSSNPEKKLTCKDIIPDIHQSAEVDALLLRTMLEQFIHEHQEEQDFQIWYSLRFGKMDQYILGKKFKVSQSTISRRYNKFQKVVDDYFKDYRQES